MTQNRVAGRSGARPLFVSRGVRSEAAFGRPPPTRESYRDGLPMSNLSSRMTIPASNGPPAPIGSLRLEAGTDATSGNEIIGSGESARRAGDRGRTTCGRVTGASDRETNVGIHVAAGLQVAVRKSRCRPLTCNSLVRRRTVVGLPQRTELICRAPWLPVYHRTAGYRIQSSEQSEVVSVLGATRKLRVWCD